MYSRQNPSPRYTQLLALNQILHENGEPFLDMPPEKVFPGSSLAFNASWIKKYVEVTGARTLLDYGAGKGVAWLNVCKDPGGRKYPSLKEYFGLSQVYCYDPAYKPFATFPEGQSFDGVIALDVLEHCPEEDLPWIMKELFEFARSFLFANIACYPGVKHLPNGENAHCTVRPIEWWEEMIEGISKDYPGLLWEFKFEFRNQEGNMEKAYFSSGQVYSDAPLTSMTIIKY